MQESLLENLYTYDTVGCETGRNYLDQYLLVSTEDFKDYVTYHYTRNGKKYTLEATVVKGIKKGKALLFDSIHVVIANLVFKNDELTGDCVIRNDNYVVVFRGKLVNGRREGKCWEYDCDGKESFFGYYKNGKKFPQLSEIKNHPSFFFEYSPVDNSIISISQYTSDQSKKNGICYVFEGGAIKKECRMKEGVDHRLVRLFTDTIMTEFDRKGRRIYEGGYIVNSDIDYQRHGKGIEYSDGGEVILYQGEFANNKRLVSLECVADMKGYYAEKTLDGATLTIAQYYHNMTKKHGICFEFSNDMLSRQCRYQNGVMTRMIREFKESTMIEFNNVGQRAYEGGYKGDYHTGFVREGEGMEINADGSDVIYKGEFKDGVREGKGVMFKRNCVWFRGTWSHGYPNGQGSLMNKKGEETHSGVWSNGQINEGNVVVDFETGHERKGFTRKCNKRVINIRFRSWWKRQSKFVQYMITMVSWIVLILLSLLIIVSLIHVAKTLFGEKLYTINNRNDLNSIPKYVRSLTVSSNSCNDGELTELVLTGFVRLRSIEVKNDCFSNVTHVSVYGLNQLDSLKIGNSSFSKKNRVGDVIDIGFHLTYCPKLKSLEIGSYSFMYFSVFVIKGLSSLRTIIIGYSREASCFQSVSSVDFIDLPSLETVELGFHSFEKSQYIRFENLPQLQSLILHEGALEGDDSDDRQSIPDLPFNWKNTLSMRDLPAISSLTMDGWNLLYIGNVTINSTGVSFLSIRYPNTSIK